jgi:hypothetical protein
MRFTASAAGCTASLASEGELFMNEGPQVCSKTARRAVYEPSCYLEHAQLHPSQVLVLLRRRSSLQPLRRIRVSARAPDLLPIFGGDAWTVPSHLLTAHKAIEVTLSMVCPTTP